MWPYLDQVEIQDSIKHSGRTTFKGDLSRLRVFHIVRYNSVKICISMYYWLNDSVS